MSGGGANWWEEAGHTGRGRADLPTRADGAEDPGGRGAATGTCGLGLRVAGPGLAGRAALRERTTDESAEAREKGIRGLARRHDPRAITPMAELPADPAGAHVLTFGAAAILGSPELLPFLREYGSDDAGVAAAVAACDPVRRARLDAAAWELLCALDRLRPELNAAVYVERFGSGVRLGLGAVAGSPGYDVEALIERADGDPARAAGLVADGWVVSSGGG